MTHNKKHIITRRGFLGSTAALGITAMLPSRAFANPTAKRIIIVRASGGWDVTYCMDPKMTSSSIDGPDSDANGSDEEITSYAGNSDFKVMTNPNKRPSVDSFFSAYAENTVIVNGIYTGSIVHDECRRRMYTGIRSMGHPDLGVIASATNGTTATLPYIDLTGGAYVGDYAAITGQLGAQNQIIALLDRNLQVPAPQNANYSYPIFETNADIHSAIENFTDQRVTRLSNKGYSGTITDKRIEDLLIALDRKRDMENNSSVFTDNLNFGSSGTFLSQTQLATTLISSGMCYGVGLTHTAGWDTHDNIADQHVAYENLFQGLNTLVSSLQAAGIFDDTIIMVTSEMTRTPRKNSDGGKDHWSSTSAMLIGGGLNGGQVLGGTNDSLMTRGIDLTTGQADDSQSPLSYDQFAAGVLHAAGITDTQTWIPNAEVLHGIVD